MAVVATINTNFTATTGQLEKGTKRVQQAVKSTIAGITAGSFANISSAISAVRGIVAFQIGKALVSAIAGGIEKLDQVAKQAKNVGLAPDQFQSLGFAAEQSGSDAETLQRALGKMANKIAEAADGSEEAQESFKNLGLDFEQLRMMSTQGAFFKIVDAMNKTQDSFGKVQSSIDIFSKSGVQLISTIVEGSSGIKALQSEFGALHGKLTDLQFAGVELASDAMGRLMTAFSGLRNQINSSAAPGIVLFADALAESTAAAFTAARGQFVLAKAYLELNKSVGDKLQPAFTAHARFEAAAQGAIANVFQTLSDLQVAPETMGPIAESIRKNAKIFSDAADKAEGSTTASQVLDEKWKKIMREMEALKFKNIQLREAVGMAATMDEHPSKAAIKAQEKAAKAFDRLSPGALERGSVGAANAIAEAMKRNPAELQQIKLDEERNRLLERIERDLHDPKLVLAQSALNN